MVNPTKGKKHSNVRASGSDEATVLSPPRTFSVEECLEYVQDDELVEVTPTSLRLRKRILDESTRRKIDRDAKKAVG